jgi:hypothetical protein
VNQLTAGNSAQCSEASRDAGVVLEIVRYDQNAGVVLEPVWYDQNARVVLETVQYDQNARVVLETVRYDQNARVVLETVQYDQNVGNAEFHSAECLGTIHCHLASSSVCLFISVRISNSNSASCTPEDVVH